MAYTFITENEIAWLPADPVLAFLRFEQICRERMNERFDRMTRDDYDGGIKEEYMAVIAAAAEAYDIPNIPTDVSGDASERFDWFYREVTRETMRLRLKHKVASASQSVDVPENDKRRIQRHIEKLREAIQAADNLPAKRKAAALKKLEHLSNELEKPRVSFAVVAAAIAAASVSLHQVEQSIIDAPKTIDAIMQLLGRAKADEEEEHPELSLPPPPLQLPSPQEAPEPLAKSQLAFDSDLDDDVPF
jgi:hypothetical protein